MKLQFLVLLLYSYTTIHAHFHIRGTAEKRDTSHKKKNINGPKCVLNDTITNDYEILSSAVSESKYIFTARVLSVRKIKRGSKVRRKIFMTYKLYVRLVMKGDVPELRSHGFLGDERTLNGAIVFVDWLRTNECAYKLYRHSSGIFLSDGFYEKYSWRMPRLRLLYEPLPLSLYDLDRVNAALKELRISGTSENVTVRMKKNVLSWFGHVERMSDERMAKKIYDGKVSGKRDKGRRDTGGRSRKKHKDPPEDMYKEVDDSGRSERAM